MPTQTTNHPASYEHPADVETMMINMPLAGDLNNPFVFGAWDTTRGETWLRGLRNRIENLVTRNAELHVENRQLHDRVTFLQNNANQCPPTV